jgi:hypothetical protein
VANKPNKTIAGKILVTACIIKVFLVKKNTSTKIGKIPLRRELRMAIVRRTPSGE